MSDVTTYLIDFFEPTIDSLEGPFVGDVVDEQYDVGTVQVFVKHLTAERLAANIMHRE